MDSDQRAMHIKSPAERIEDEFDHLNIVESWFPDKFNNSNRC